MSSALIFTGAFAACVSCGGAQPTSSVPSSSASKLEGASPAQDPLAFRFDWSAPCRVPVVESATLKGRTARIAYNVSVAQRNESLDVSLQDFDFLEFDGHKTSAEEREQLQPVLDVASTVPMMQVSKDGHYLGCEGLHDMLERVARLRQMTPERAARVQRVLDSPKMAATIQANIGMYWATWVESWLGWTLAPRADQTTEENQPLAGEDARAVVRREFLGLRDGYATLQQTTTFKGEPAARAIASLVSEIAAQALAPTESGPAFKEARIEVKLYAETSVRGLRPRRTRFEKKYEVVPSTGDKLEGRELREVVWHWEQAQGCQRTQ